MGKPKKGKKGRQDDDFGDDDVDLDPLMNKEDSEEVISAKPSTKAGKKGKKKKTADWEDDDVAAELAELSLQQKQDDSDMNEEVEETIPQAKNKKKDKKKSKKKVESEEEDLENMDADDIEFAGSKPFTGKSMGGFSMLMDDDSVGEASSEGEEQPIKQTETKKNTKKQKSVEDDQNKENDEGKSNQKKKGKKEKKKKKDDEEDLDALLAEIEGKQGPEKGIEFKDLSSLTQEEIAKAMEAEYEEDDRKKKKKKKKGGKDVEKQEKMDDENEEEEDDDDGDEEEGGTVKTAAQKKKEKKERQKQKKLEEKSKQKNKKNKQETTEEGKDDKVLEKMEAPEDRPESSKKEDGDEEKPAEDKDEEGEDDDKKKKKKDRRKKKGEKEEEKETKKKPSKMAKLIQEQQQKIKEEEERIRLEMEEKERKIEEALKAKEELERQQREKKERDKQKKREKIEKQKKEGTFLTAKQKEAQKRAQQMLEAMKAQGYSVAAEDAPKKKKPVYEKKKKKPLTSQDSIDSKEPEVVTPVEEKPLVIENTEEKVEEKKVKEDVKDAWDASDEEVKDAWDAESDTEEKPTEKEVPEKKARISESSSKKDEESEEEESEEEESSDEESEEEDSSEEESSSDDDLTVAEKARQKALNRIHKRKETAEKNKTTDVLRAAVVVVLGHVDTGKTKILDKLRRTNVQDNEAGGITQQIGATNVPVHAIRDSTKMCKEFTKQELKLPGLLIIDTPGHESFSNLRSRGSSLCDIAILVVDIMHGLEPQTIESINLLKERKCPFVVALNKIDRLYGWQANPHSDVINVIKKQKQNTKLEFEERAQQVMVQFAEQGLNAKLFYENKNPKEYISLVPTSAHSGDGMGNLVALICELSQTHLAKKLAYSEELQATVMEVKAIHGLGTTIDVILVNGKMNEGDTIIVPGTEGPIVTQVRGLLMPQPMRELRVKNAYEHHKEVMAAQGIKIIAKDLDHSLAGLPVHVAHFADEIDIYKEEVKTALEDILSSIKLSEKGVFVQASTLGSLEALLQFLKDSKIPYAGINIGPVHKKDVMKVSVMLDRDPQYGAVLAFDVKVEREAQELADSLGIRIFSAEIIYHLFDSFMAYRDEYKKSKQDEFKNIAVFPCKLRVLPQCIFNSRDPIVMGVAVEAGFVKMGTPICVPSKENVFLGHITSLEINHKQIDKATKGQEVCIKIENIPGETPKLYGRHFDHTDMLISRISRESIDAVKNYFRDEMGKTDWQLILELKKLFEIL